MHNITHYNQTNKKNSDADRDADHMTTGAMDEKPEKTFSKIMQL